MNLTSKIANWGNVHYRPWMAPLRMFFGLFLVAKGLYFIQHSDYILKWFHTLQFKDVLAVISILFAFLHIFLGCFILIGLATRLSCIIMIPVIIGSLFFTNPNMSSVLQILFTLISLIGCAFFMAEGSGRFSVYYYFTHSNETEPDKLSKPVGEVNGK